MESESICSKRADIQTDGRTDRQTDKTKLIVAFDNFANAANKKRPLTLPSEMSYVTEAERISAPLRITV